VLNASFFRLINNLSIICRDPGGTTGRIGGMNPDSDLTYRIIGLAMRVHGRLGPGLLESVYHRCLCHELSRANLQFDQQVQLPIRYDEIEIDSAIWRTSSCVTR
jgi:hypothetical protein